MDIFIHRSDGIPDVCLLSVRVGSTRRQAIFEHGRPLRFPAEAAAAGDLQVDFLQVLGKGRVDLKSKAGKHSECHSLQLESSTGVPMSCDLEVRRHVDGSGAEKKSGAARPASAGRPPTGSRHASRRHEAARLSAQKYMEQHNLVEAVQAALQATVKAGPENPIPYMAEQLLRGFGGATRPGAPPDAIAVSESPPLKATSTVGTGSVVGTSSAAEGGVEASRLNPSPPLTASAPLASELPHRVRARRMQSSIDSVVDLEEAEQCSIIGEAESEANAELVAEPFLEALTKREQVARLAGGSSTEQGGDRSPAAYSNEYADVGQSKAPADTQDAPAESSDASTSPEVVAPRSEVASAVPADASLRPEQTSASPEDAPPRLEPSSEVTGETEAKCARGLADAPKKQVTEVKARVLELLESACLNNRLAAAIDFLKEPLDPKTVRDTKLDEDEEVDTMFQSAEDAERKSEISSITQDQNLEDCDDLSDRGGAGVPRDLAAEALRDMFRSDVSAQSCEDVSSATRSAAQSSIACSSQAARRGEEAAVTWALERVRQKAVSSSNVSLPAPSCGGAPSAPSVISQTSSQSNAVAPALFAEDLELRLANEGRGVLLSCPERPSPPSMSVASASHASSSMAAIYAEDITVRHMVDKIHGDIPKLPPLPGSPSAPSAPTARSLDTLSTEAAVPRAEAAVAMELFGKVCEEEFKLSGEPRELERIRTCLRTGLQALVESGELDALVETELSGRGGAPPAAAVAASA